MYALGTISSILCFFFVLIGISGGFCIKIATNIVGIVIVDRYRYVHVHYPRQNIIDLCGKYIFGGNFCPLVIYLSKYDGNYFWQIENLKLDYLSWFPVCQWLCEWKRKPSPKFQQKTDKERMRQGLKDLYCSTLNSEIGKSKLKQWIETTGCTADCRLTLCFLSLL